MELQVQAQDRCAAAAIVAGTIRLLLNLSGVTGIDDFGSSELFSAFTTTINRGAKMKLENLPTAIDNILHIAQLIAVFDVFDNEDEAVESFA